MSATMDVDHFSKYFDNATVLYVKGRQHPVQVRMAALRVNHWHFIARDIQIYSVFLLQLLYTGDPQKDYLFASLVTVFQIHQEEPQ